MEEECRRKRQMLQRKPINNDELSEVPPIVHEVLRSPGRPLEKETRAFFEPRFGHDFSNVRVHTDTKAVQSALAVNALAYTLGRDVVFGTGQYQMRTVSGRHLLAHELAHVIQQEKNTGGQKKFVQPWHASGHKMITEKMTRKLLGFFPGFIIDETALNALVNFSTDMDNKIRELWFNIGAVGGIRVPIASALFGRPGQTIAEYYKSHKDTALNHGEGGCYDEKDEVKNAQENLQMQNFYAESARKAFKNRPRRFKSISESEMVKPRVRNNVLSILGDALHVAQDRGSHREGTKGLGHTDPKKNCDEPSENREGLKKAENNTELLLLEAEDLLLELLDIKYRTTHTATFGTPIQRSVDINSSVPNHITGLSISKTDDHCEQEAEQVADNVIRMPVSKNINEKRLVENPEFRSLPLDKETRNFFEPRFGHDFSKVRIHTDSKAADSARTVNALAYTVGQAVVFNVGRYAPSTSNGQKLLAHELAHVVQQEYYLPSGSVAVSNNDSPQERAAEAATNAVIDGRAACQVQSSALILYRRAAPYIKKITVHLSPPQHAVLEWKGTPPANATGSDRFTVSTGKGYSDPWDPPGTCSRTCCKNPDTQCAPPWNRPDKIGSCCTYYGNNFWTGHPLEEHNGWKWWTPIQPYYSSRGIALHQHTEVTGQPIGHGCVRMDEPNAKRIYDYSNGHHTNVTIDGRAAPVACEKDRKCSSSPGKRVELEGSESHIENRLLLVEEPVVPGLKGVMT